MISPIGATSPDRIAPPASVNTWDLVIGRFFSRQSAEAPGG